ncbi:scavenger receptor cysteine-rich type 1 protein M160-like [Cololabis saira]|uniref:scavenger receptor cysteine-rich type 1 protein M160-like n=1 Tax=Cololabis saira TaxID=129043 RepID=UPI002AD45E55|nr:scavenger receptor cysteine-rich type 1 protein M160-like [Cololabis saira]
MRGTAGLSSEHPAVSSAEIRLVEGAGRCAGRLERKTQGKWTPEEEDLTGDWNLTSAATMCRQLDCGSVVSIRRTSSSSDRPDALTSMLNLESSDIIVFRSSFSHVEFICSDSVRLVNGSSRCSGRLEVKSNQSWSPVSQHAFDQHDAEVVCRELDCGSPSVLQGALYGDPEAPVWSREFNCTGDESTLQDCGSSVTRYSGKAVEVTCSGPEDVRLVGGSSRCGGTLEMKQWGEWKPVFTDYWKLRFSGEVCRQLNCGSPISTKRMKTSQRIIWTFRPNCDDPTFTKCFTRHKYSSDSIEITCSDSVRLVNGSNWCSGRLEVKSNQVWSSVCEEDFDRQDAEVVCKELGCGAPSDLQGALHGEKEAPVWSRAFHCEGHESSLLDCESSGLKRNTCPPGKAVVLTCSDPVDVKLVGGANRCTGQLQVKHSGVWRPAFDINRGWNQKVSDFVCGRLDCGSSVTTAIREHQEELVWWISSHCIEIKSMMGECVMLKGASNPFVLEITCSASTGPVRLVGGPDRCSGRLEVKSSQVWSSVCEEDFDRQDAEVVCKELSCGDLSVLRGAVYGETGAPVWRREFHCGGNESFLLDCNRTSSAVKTCHPGKAAHVTCSEYVRLVGENSRCAGTLEMFYRGEWRPVVNWDPVWNQSSTSVVCAQLGCGTAVSSSTRESTDRPVWWIRSSCLHSASSLQQCLTLTVFSEIFYRLEVICSDLLVKPNISLSSSTDGVSKSQTQGSQVLLGSDFSIICSILPQYQGGFFQLIFTTPTVTQLCTLPAVNHSALFLFSAANLTHQGNCRCVYHVQVFSHNFSSMGPPLSLRVSEEGRSRDYRESMVLLMVVVPKDTGTKASKSREGCLFLFQTTSFTSYLIREVGSSDANLLSPPVRTNQDLQDPHYKSGASVLVLRAERLSCVTRRHRRLQELLLEHTAGGELVFWGVRVDDRCVAFVCSTSSRPRQAVGAEGCGSEGSSVGVNDKALFGVRSVFGIDRGQTIAGATGPQRPPGQRANVPILS